MAAKKDEFGFEPDEPSKAPADDFGFEADDGFVPDAPAKPESHERSLGTLSYENQGMQPSKAAKMRGEIDKFNKYFSDTPGQVRSMLQGNTGGLADELVSAGETAFPALSSWENLLKSIKGEKVEGKSYVENRAANRPVYKKAVEDHPLENFVGAATMPVPGAGKAKGAAGILKTLLQGAMVGGINGAGNSEADLTKGDAAGFAKDTLKGAGIGLATSTIPAAIGYGRERVASTAAKGLAKAESDAATQAEKSVQDAIDSARGKYRSSIQNASRDLEVLEREAERGTGAAKQKAQDFLATDEAQKLRERVLNGKLETAPERIAEMDGLQTSLNELRGSRGLDIDAKSKQILDKGIMGNLAPRIRTTLNRAIPTAVGAGATTLGYKLGMGPAASTALGGGAGLLTASVMGNRGTAFANAVNAPGFRASLYDKLGSLVAEGAMGKYGQILSDAAARGPEALLSTHYILTKQFPEYANLTSNLSPTASAKADYTDKYNTKLSPSDEQKFQEWAQKVGKAKDLADYDLRGAWKAGAATTTGHLPDTFKKPNHPTFSDESQYNGADGMTGGKWTEDASGTSFEPSSTNIKNLGEDGLREYFKKTEPKSRLKLQ